MSRAEQRRLPAEPALRSRPLLSVHLQAQLRAVPPEDGCTLRLPSRAVPAAQLLLERLDVSVARDVHRQHGQALRNLQRRAVELR